MATGLLIDAAGHEQLERSTGHHGRRTEPFANWCASKKLLVMDRLFGSELTALARSLRRLTGSRRGTRTRCRGGDGEHGRVPHVHAAAAFANGPDSASRPPSTTRQDVTGPGGRPRRSGRVVLLMATHR
jgi:hypothetical protein